MHRLQRARGGVEKTADEQGLIRGRARIIGRCMLAAHNGQGLQAQRQGCYRARQRLLRGLAALADGRCGG